MFNAYLTSTFFLQKTVFYFFSPLLHNGIQISYSLSFSSLDTPIPPQCPYMSPFLSKSPTAKCNATSAGGMQLTAVDVCSPIARLLLNYIIIFINFTHVLNQCLWAKTFKPQEKQGGILTGLGKSKNPFIPPPLFW